MRFALILEDRNTVYHTLREYLGDVDPEIEPLRFRSFQEFASWFRYGFIHPPESEEVSQEGENSGAGELPPEETPEGQRAPPQRERPTVRALKESDRVVLLIANHRILGAQHKQLLVKMSQVLKLKEHLAEGAPFLPALFVVNETDETFALDDYKELFISNFLFKPFDKVVCKAKITWALYGKEALNKVELYKEAPHTLIEMRKDIQALELSETGFKVLASRPLPEGRLAKYYGSDFFNNRPKDGLLAKTVGESIPSAKYEGQYEVGLKFVGVDSNHIRSVRSKLEEITGENARDEAASGKGSPVGIVILSEDKTASHQLKEQLEESYSNLSIKTFGNFVDFLINVDPEYGAQELVAQQQELFSEGSVVLQFNHATDGFLKAEAEGDVFGISKNQLSSIKSLLLSQLKPEERVGLTEFWSQADESQVFTMKIMVENAPCVISLCERKVEEKVMSFKMRLATEEEVTRYVGHKSDLVKPLGAVFVSERIADRRDFQYWETLRQKMIKADFHSGGYLRLFKLATKAVVDKDIADRDQAFDATFVQVVDHRYLTLKVSEYVSGLKPKRERPVEHVAASEARVQSAVLVALNQVNEVSLVLPYARSITPGRYRYFSFWNTKNQQFEIFLAKCVDTEKDPDSKDRYLNYFLFFGLGDTENSFLRGWMIDQYRATKAAAKDQGA